MNALFDRYKDLIARLGAQAVDHPDVILGSSGQHLVRYIPFEHVNADARLVIVGITPGSTQMDLAYGTVQRVLKTGGSPTEALAAAKREGAFGGPTMRPNLIKMLQAFGFPKILGIKDPAELWGSAAHLLHATSVVPHAAFVGDKLFAGSFDKVMATPVLKEMFEKHFVPSLEGMDRDAMYVALGPTPLAALDWCAERGFLQPDQILGAFAHPSGSGGSQVAIYLGEKDPAELSEADPVRHRVPGLIEAAARMHASTQRIGGGLSQAPSAPPVVNSRRDEPARTRTATTSGTTRAGAPKIAQDEEAMVQAFVAADFEHAHETSKVILFRRARDGKEVYFVRGAGKRKIVVSPADEKGSTALADRIGARHDGQYNNSNMRRFPTHQNGGKGLIHFGFGFSFSCPDRVRSFLNEL